MTAAQQRSIFISENLGLVHACAGRFRGRGIEYEELYASGCVGLVKAYDGFDVSRGLCFSTYAVPVILGEIKKLFRDGGAVKVSRSVKELGLKINAARERYVKQHGSEPCISWLARQLEVTEEQIVTALSAAQPVLSLTPVDDEAGGREFDVPQESCEESLACSLSLQAAMGTLPAEDRKIIFLRFYRNKTQSETAALLHTTQVQISRRERKILAVLRNFMNE